MKDPLNEKMPPEQELGATSLAKIQSTSSHIRTYPAEFFVKLGLRERLEVFETEHFLIAKIQSNSSLLHSLIIEHLLI